MIATFLLKTAIGQTDIKKPLSIGDHHGGGIIFSIDPSGKHGLIAAPLDLSETTCWGAYGMSNANYMNEGDLNTKAIVTLKKKHLQEYLDCKVPAACMCDTLNFGGVTDWYLPSINELKEIYDKQKVIGNFIAGDYCSSTASSKSNCWNVHFRPHRKIIYEGDRYFNNYYVRCIRKF